MRYLRYNSATIVTVGPFVDRDDGVTLETALTITNERISFTVDANDGSAPTLVLDNVTGATLGTDNDLNYIANCDAGLMQLELSAANVNYLGRAFLTITDAANHVPVFHEFMILPAHVYDGLVTGTDNLQVDTVQAAGTAWGSGAITAGSIAVDAIGASELAADSADKIADALLARNVAGGSSTGRLVKEALYPLRNRVAVSGGTMTVYGVDDSTSSWTAVVTTTEGANPITSINPEGGSA